MANNKKAKQLGSDIYIEQTKRWIKEFVIDLNLCPFAKHPFQNELIRYKITEFSTTKNFVLFFLEELQVLIEAKSTTISTSLIIVPNGLEKFLHFLDVLETCQDVLDRSDLVEVIQLASFHPKYQFQGTDKDDVTNYTNRSPYPMIHLLRTIEVENAIESYGDIVEISDRNQALMKTMDIKDLNKK